MNHVDLHHGAATDVGHVREVNEDSFLVAPPIFAVADGMGGHSGGDVASRIVVEEFARLAQDYDPLNGALHLTDAFVRAQARIAQYAFAQQATQPAWHAGTTAVVAALVEDEGETKWLLANLGDSRAYRLGAEGLVQISVDHSVVQELVDAGQITPAEAAVHPERHIITRALGSPESVEPDFFLLPLASAERLMLCTDGVSGMIDDQQICGILESVDDPRDAAATLVRAALDAGGRDNATAIVVDVMGLVRHEAYDSRIQRESLESKLGGRL